jgi:hypothetical protein
MNRVEPPGGERRASERRAPSYTPQEIDDLRITRVHFREELMFCLLSDGNRICVPLTIVPALLEPQRHRYQWQIADDGRSVLWYKSGMGLPSERLNLAAILAHPEAQLTFG